jgi:hypothetical protein
MSANYDFGQRCGGHQPSSKSASVGNVLSARGGTAAIPKVTGSALSSYLF